uniref:Uncharacterized protein n=1 Tax=Oryza brachyantha TaxID=4533 RepID=J3M5V8_ORYBR
MYIYILVLYHKHRVLKDLLLAIWLKFCWSHINAHCNEHTIANPAHARLKPLKLKGAVSDRNQAVKP